MTMPKGWRPPRQKDTDGNVKYKQWLTTQLRGYVDECSSEIRSDKQLFLNNMGKLPTLLHDIRTVFIPILAAIITILIGLKDVPPISLWFPSLPIILIVGLILGILVIELLRSLIERKITTIGFGYDIINFRLTVLKGFISRMSIDIDYLKEYELRNFWDFVVIYYGDRSDLAQRFQEASKALLMLWYKGELTNGYSVSRYMTEHGTLQFRRLEHDLLRNPLVQAFLNTPEGRNYMNRYSSSAILT